MKKDESLGGQDLVGSTKPSQKPERADSDEEKGQEKEGPDFQDIVESAPPEVRAAFMQMTRTVGGLAGHPLFHKFTPQHIDKFLDYSHQDDIRAYSLASSNRWFHLAYIILALAFLGFFIVFLAPSHKDLLIDILRLLVAFAGGFGAGFGVKSWMEKRK